MLTGIDHVVLNVSDVERSVRWYADLFGLAAERLDEWRAGTVPFASLRVTESFIIDLFEAKPTGENVDHVAFVTDPGFFAEFVAAHSDVIEGPPRMLFGAAGVGEGVYLRDPDGFRVELRTY